MQTLYLTESDWQLSKRSRHLQIKRDGIVSEEIPTHNLRRIIVFGNSRISTDLLDFLAHNGIEVAYLSKYGRFRFRMVPEKSKNIFLRLAQFEKFHDSEFRLELGRVLVKAKIRNQRSLLLRYQRNQPETELGEDLAFFGSVSGKLDKALDFKTIMGIEGGAARCYFSGLNRFLKGGFEIKNRSYHPPRDPVNSMLSFGYMLVFAEINSLLEAFGLDPLLGFLHSPKYGRASLATDLLEQFRAPVVDRLILYLVNKRIVKQEYFEDGSGSGVSLNREARKKFLMNYEKFVSDVFLLPDLGMKKNFRGLFRDAVLNLEKTILDKVPYRPFLYSS